MEKIHVKLNPAYLLKQKWNKIIQKANNHEFTEEDIGLETQLMINDSLYDVVLIGVNHDNLANGEKANTTWQLKNCYNTLYPMDSSSSNLGGYEKSLMNKETLPSIFNLIDKDVKNNIKPVIKKTSIGNQSTTIVDSTCNLFLLSEVEIFGETTYSASGEGSQYAYYIKQEDKRKGLQFDTTSYVWWSSRSPHATSVAAFCRVTSSGKPSGVNASSSGGISFAFCI